MKAWSASQFCSNEMCNAAFWPLESCKNASNPPQNTWNSFDTEVKLESVSAMFVQSDKQQSDKSLLLCVLKKISVQTSSSSHISFSLSFSGTVKEHIVCVHVFQSKSTTILQD